jgi:hypothetical protein
VAQAQLERRPVAQTRLEAPAAEQAQAQRRARHAGRHLTHAQRLLGHPGGRRDEREAHRVGRAHRPAEVDDAEHLAARRVVDRGRRAPPRVLLGEEVLGREDLHGVVDREGGADGVGPGAGLGPQHALLEGDAVGAMAHARVALDPQDPPRPVDDDHDVLGVHGEATQAAAQDVDARAQRRGVAAVGQLVGGEGALRMQVVGVEAGADHAPPGLLDHGPHRRGRAIAAQHRLP